MLKKLKETIVLTASYYGFNLNPQILTMYVDDLSDLPIDQVIWAYGEYRKNPKNRVSPLPAQIREIVQPNISEDDQANLIASKITESINKFGWNKPNEVKEYVGSIGWAAIEGWGGWLYICENHGKNLNPTAFNAQNRGNIKSMLLENKVQVVSTPMIEHNEIKQIENSSFDFGMLPKIKSVEAGG